MSSSEGGNVAPVKNQRYAVIIILTAFGIAGALAGLAIWQPDAAMRVEALVTLVVGGLFGFIAGRKA